MPQTALPTPAKKKPSNRKAKPPINHVTTIPLMTPTIKQRETLERWFAGNRFVYNKCVQESYDQRKTGVFITESYLRKKFVNNGAYDPTHWILKVPVTHRESAVKDFFQAYITEIMKVSANPNHRFKMSFRSRKDPRQSFVVPSRSYRREPQPKKPKKGDPVVDPPPPPPPEGFSYARKCFKDAGCKPFILRTRDETPLVLTSDSRLIRMRLGKYFLAIPDHRESTVRHPREAPDLKVCALDPGCRTFQTIYDPQGFVIEIGEGDMANKIAKLCWRADRFVSKIATCEKRKTRYRLRRIQLRINQRIRDLMKDVHCKLAKYLVHNYDVVYLPAFESSQMVLKKSSHRNISSKTARAMLTWSHYKFKQRLLYNASLTDNQCKVIVCTEEYTSKTCGRCGWQHANLGSSKQFRCGSCGLRVDRDHNGARNILLKNVYKLGGGETVSRTA